MTINDQKNYRAGLLNFKNLIRAKRASSLFRTVLLGSAAVCFGTFAMSEPLGLISGSVGIHAFVVSFLSCVTAYFNEKYSLGALETHEAVAEKLRYNQKLKKIARLSDSDLMLSWGKCRFETLRVMNGFSYERSCVAGLNATSGESMVVWNDHENLMKINGLETPSKAFSDAARTMTLDVELKEKVKRDLALFACLFDRLPVPSTGLDWRSTGKLTARTCAYHPGLRRVYAQNKFAL